MQSEIIIPIEHAIVDGVYTRVASAKAGTMIIGNAHKKGGFAFLLSGTIKQIDGDLEYEVTAPTIIQTKAGSQRTAYVVTDCVYSTVHAVDATTFEEAELELFEGVSQITRIQNSYKGILTKLNMTDEEVQGIMEDCIVEDSDNFYLAPSTISGTGVFAKIDFSPNTCITMSVLDNQRLATSRYTNHSDIPNARFIDYNNDSLALVATRFISKDSEILIDYRERLGLLCHQQ